MDNRAQPLGFANNHFSLNAFESLRRIIQVGPECHADTTLRLQSPGASIMHISISKGAAKRKWNDSDGSLCLDDVSSLDLGLGRYASSSENKESSATARTYSSVKEINEESSMELGLNIHMQCGNEKSSYLKKWVAANQIALAEPKCDLELSLSTGPSESVISSETFRSVGYRKNLNMPSTVHIVYDEDNGPTHPLKLRSVLPTSHGYFFSPISSESGSVLSVPDSSSSGISLPKSSVTCTSGVTQSTNLLRSSNSKKCQFKGCSKGARGASGLCIAHGGGRRCQKHGCNKGAEGRTVFCKAHGGGRRCQFLGCTKSSEGRTNFCIAHGGGRRCSHEGCTRAARGKSGLCIRHGGGKRCQHENCTKSAEGLSGLCISHGGGRRCQYSACSKGAQGSTMFCKAHGGGKRCTAPGCAKGAEGSTPFCKGHGGGKRCSFEGCPKSVHGGTQFCVAHGGGKRCAFPECTKSARGRTDFCVRHGGGKRCKHDGCGKSAQGSSDFCKAHGGGKRCAFGHPQLGVNGQTPSNPFAREKAALCATHRAPVQDNRVHGGGTLGPAAGELELGKPEEMNDTKEEVHFDVMTGNKDESFVKRDDAVPKEFGYPALVVGRSLGPCMLEGKVESPLNPFPVPEGRVHGGSLLARLAGDTEMRRETDPALGVGHKWV